MLISWNFSEPPGVCHTENSGRPLNVEQMHKGFEYRTYEQGIKNVEVGPRQFDSTCFIGRQE
jgi:hypothetical protein